jgi:hypothetical protein
VLSLDHVQSLAAINEVKLLLLFPCWRFGQPCVGWRLDGFGAKRWVTDDCDGNVMGRKDEYGLWYVCTYIVHRLMKNQSLELGETGQPLFL